MKEKQLVFWSKWGLTALVAMASLAAAYGNEHQLRLGDPNRPVVTVQARFVGYCERIGSYGYVTGWMQNHTAQDQAVHVNLQVPNNPASSQKDVAVPARNRSGFLIPWPCLHNSPPELRVETSNPELSASVWMNQFSLYGPKQSALVVSNNGPTEKAEAALEALWNQPHFDNGNTSANPSRKKFFHEWVTPQQLPASWFLLTGFDVILLEGYHPAWSEAQLSALQDYVKAGGLVIILDAGSFPVPWMDGWQNHVTEVRVGQEPTQTQAQGTWGQGSFFLYDGPLCKETNCYKSSKKMESQAQRLAEANPTVPEQTHLAPALGALPETWLQGWTVPELQQVPLVGFVVALGLFALLMGPVNYWYWYRRKKQPVMVLISIPAMGLLFTTGLLTYGLLSEGLGIHGSTTSFTWLDQRSQEAVTTATRTLYAATSPASLSVGQHTYAMPIELTDAHVKDFPSSPYRWDFRVSPTAMMEVEGSAIPARTPVSLLTVTVEHSPVRFEFRHTAEDTLELARTSSGPSPEGIHTVLVRDFAGRYYFQSPGETRLRLVADKTHLRALLSPWDHQEAIHRQQEYWNRWTSKGTELPKGSYVATLVQNNLVNTLGLSVAYQSQEHVVCGLLAPENIHD